MVSTFSINKGYQLQGTGDNAGTWGSILNTNVFTIIDNNMGSNLAINAAGSSNITLTPTQAENLSYSLTGALTGNIQLIFPTSAGFFALISNLTTGNFTVTVITATGGSVGAVAPQGISTLMWSDATNVYLPINEQESGIYTLAPMYTISNMVIT